MVKTKTASLDALEINLSGQTAPGGTPAKGAIILFHGFGADSADLASLAEAVTVNDDIRWYFPNGPHVVQIGPHMSGRAWFPLRLAELEQRGVDFTQVTPEGMDKAVDQALKAVEAVRTKHSLDWKNIVIGGFSQGAMIALAVALKAPENLAGVTLFSSSLVNESQVREQAAKRRGLKFFQSHGTADQMLPFVLAERLDTILNEAGMDGMLYAFRGGHEIPLPVLREWTSWLRDRF